MGRPRSNNKNRPTRDRLTKTQLRFMRHDPACKELVAYAESQMGPQGATVHWACKQGDKEFK